MGRVTIASLKGPRGLRGDRGIPGVNAVENVEARRRIHIIDCAGQSNLSGRATAFGSVAGPGYDPVHPRIFQFPGRGASSHTLVPASEPLIMHDVATGMGPALQFARSWIEDLPPDDIIVLVPNAHGGTMLSTNTTPLGWRWGVSGNLSAQAVALTLAAKAAAEAQWPGAQDVTIDAVLWFQGETDGTNGTPAATYQTDQDALINGYRDAYGDPDLPFLICQMIPEARAELVLRQQIDDVQRDTVWRLPRVGFVENPNVGMNEDVLHANANAHRTVYGPGLYAEYKRVMSGRAPVIVPKPKTVSSIVASDDYNRADATVTQTLVGALTYTKARSVGGTLTLGIVSNHLHFTGGVGSSGISTWVIDGTETTRQRRLTVTAQKEDSPLIVLQADATDLYNVNRLVLARTSSTDGRWRVVAYTPTANTVLQTNIVIGADQEIIWEPFGTKWRIWIGGTYVGAVDKVGPGTSFGAALTGTVAGSYNTTFWDNIQLGVIA